MTAPETPPLAVFNACVQLALPSSGYEVINARKLSGGAVQENWWLDVVQGKARHDIILRCDAPASVSASHSRFSEHTILKAAFNAGVKTPEPLALLDGDNPLGRPLFLMRALKGEALGTKVVRAEAFTQTRKTLGKELARELARIHSVPLSPDLLAILPHDFENPALERVETYYAMLDEVERPSPVIELALRWLQQNIPIAGEKTFVHRDFRTGNYMVDERGLVAILDWEFCGISDPHEDLAWFLSGDWRFGRDDLEAGGIATRQAFLDAYAAESGRNVDSDLLSYWGVMAAVRWAIIALQQGERVTKGGEERVELALVARRVFPTEKRLLTLLHPSLGKNDD